MIEDYLEQIKVNLATRIIVDEFRIVEEWNQFDEGYIHIRLRLSNGDFWKWPNILGFPMMVFCPSATVISGWTPTRSICADAGIT